MIEVDKIELLKFISKAHRNTYAAPKEIRKQHRLETPFLPGHKCYYFKDGKWEYYDGYAGSEWAPGREIALLNGNPIWTMSYQGRTANLLPDKFLDNEVFPFLKKALMAASSYMPFRGPSKFGEGDFEYLFKMNGDYTYFTGKELILHKGMEIFLQDVMGELIK